MDLKVHSNNTKKQNRHIIVFSDGCDMCIEHINNVEIGKCAGCILETLPLLDKSEKIQKKILEYDVTSHPTTIIDDEIKIEGKPEFYWQCGGEFYNVLRERYPL